jgi:hypothetical protein
VIAARPERPAAATVADSLPKKAGLASEFGCENTPLLCAAALVAAHCGHCGAPRRGCSALWPLVAANVTMDGRIPKGKVFLDTKPSQGSRGLHGYAPDRRQDHDKRPHESRGDSRTAPPGR